MYVSMLVHFLKQLLNSTYFGENNVCLITKQNIFYTNDVLMAIQNDHTIYLRT